MAWLKVKTAGLPRWGWIGLLGGAAVVGLYLRSRATAKEAETESTETQPAEGEPVIGGEGGYGEGSLAGAGLIGPAGSSSVPVQTPYLPEGFTSSFETLATQLGETDKYILEHPQKETIIEREAAGGGPPQAGNHETLPTPEAPAQSPPSAPSCSQGDIDTLRSNKGQIERLQGEIQDLRNNVQAHPKAAQRGAWESNISNKQGKVQQLSAQNQQIRNKPGCSGVAV